VPLLREDRDRRLGSRDGNADPTLYHVRLRGIRKKEGAFLIPPDDLWMLGFAVTVILVLGLLLYVASRLSGKGGKPPAATTRAQDEPRGTGTPEKKRSTDLLDDVVMFGLLLTDYDDYI